MYLSKQGLIISGILLILIFGDKNVLFIFNLIALAIFLFPAKIQKSEIKLFIFLIIPVIMAGIKGFFYFPIYDVLKDIYYLINPILFLIVGLLIAKKVSLEVLIRSIIIIGSFYSIVHIITVFLSFGLGAFQDLRQVRYDEGGGNIISTISLALCISSFYFYKMEIFQANLLKRTLLLLNGLSFLFSGSRTFWIIFIVLILCITYYFYRNRIWILLMSFSLFVGIIALLVYNNQDNEFSKSLLNTTTELTISDLNNESDMNNQYRGWEFYRALKTAFEGTNTQIIFGHGAGKMIDLGTYFFLANEYRRYIPILHNGYMYALVKAGIAGVLCYIFYFFYLIRFGLAKINLSQNQNSFLPLLFIGIIICLIISNVVISGIFNSTIELLGLLCGALFYYLTKPFDETLPD